MPNFSNLIKSVQILSSGGLVAFPTETVYGLGGDATNPKAIAKIFAAKERPANHPLIVHIATVKQIHDWAREVPSAVLKLANAFWPGPLTLILKKQPHVLEGLTGGQDTVGLRIPRHPIAQKLLQAFGGGIAAPSANKFTHISPTTALAVAEELGDKVDLILDGGQCEVGLESTIIDMSGDHPVILRPGMIGADAISSVLGRDVLVRRQDTPGDVRAPGMHHLHYAPMTETKLISSQDIPHIDARSNIALVTYSNLEVPHDVAHVQMPNDAVQYAHDIYFVLRELDHKNLSCIYIEDVPENPEWDAIRDRLRKASR